LWSPVPEIVMRRVEPDLFFFVLLMAAPEQVQVPRKNAVKNYST